MALSRITQGAAAASSGSVSVAEGDLLVVFAYRSNSATAPTRPSDFDEIATVANSGGGANSSMRAGYKVAGAGGFSGTGTWTNATHLAWVVLRGQHATTPIGESATHGGNNANQSIRYDACGETAEQSGHWYLGFAGRTAGHETVATAPDGMTHVAAAPATPLVAAHATDGEHAGDWPQTTVALTGAKTCTLVAEVLAEPALATPQGSGVAALTLGAVGAGFAQAVGAGLVALTLGASAAGASVHSGSGSAALSLGAVGAGVAAAAAPAQGSGIASLDMAAAGAGAHQAVGSGPAALGLMAEGAGQSVRQGYAAAALTLEAQGTGEASVDSGTPQGSGIAPLTLDATGAGATLRRGSGVAVLALGAAAAGKGKPKDNGKGLIRASFTKSKAAAVPRAARAAPGYRYRRQRP
jgi:hypothetical protein